MSKTSERRIAELEQALGEIATDVAEYLADHGISTLTDCNRQVDELLVCIKDCATSALDGNVAGMPIEGD